MKKYNILYADPPWNGLGWNNGSGKKCPANHYQVQSLEWIKRLPVENIAADTCALFLWVTFPNLKAGIEVIETWGFRYATCAFVWIKQNKKSDSLFIGCGNYTRANAELCLLGTRGSTQKMRKNRSVQQVCVSRIREHSRKPDEIRDRIIQLFGDLPRCELFCRYPAPGWDVWGNEIESTMSLDKRENKCTSKTG